jgi:hypothetical protein
MRYPAGPCGGPERPVEPRRAAQWAESASGYRSRAKGASFPTGGLSPRWFSGLARTVSVGTGRGLH